MILDLQSIFPLEIDKACTEAFRQWGISVRVALNLCFKTNSRAKLFTWKMSLICVRMNLWAKHIFIRMFLKQRPNATRNWFSERSCSASFLWLCLRLRPHSAGRIWKRRFHSENASNVFRPHCARGIWKRNNHRSFWICVWGKLG